MMYDEHDGCGWTRLMRAAREASIASGRGHSQLVRFPDHQHDAGAGRTFHAEDPMKYDEHDGCGWTRLTRAAREASIASGRGHSHPVRFWIISMMLVLVGLSTLKIR
jgi:hypothetical protein